MASRGEELAQKDIEKLQSMSFEELLEAVDKGNNPLHELELWERIDQKRERQDELDEKSEKLIEEAEEDLPVSDLDEGEEVRKKINKIKKINREMSELTEDLNRAKEVLPDGEDE